MHGVTIYRQSETIFSHIPSCLCLLRSVHTAWAYLSPDFGQEETSRSYNAFPSVYANTTELESEVGMVNHAKTIALLQDTATGPIYKMLFNS